MECRDQRSDRVPWELGDWGDSSRSDGLDLEDILGSMLNVAGQ